MRLNQVEPIRQAIFGGRLALAVRVVLVHLVIEVADRSRHEVDCYHENNHGRQKRYRLYRAQNDTCIHHSNVELLVNIHRSLLPVFLHFLVFAFSRFHVFILASSSGRGIRRGWRGCR